MVKTYAEAGAPPRPTRGADRSMWRWDATLPVARADAVTLGEGGTPLVSLPRAAKALGLREVWAKDESRNPTWSFKDRLASSAISSAKAQGAKEFAKTYSQAGTRIQYQAKDPRGWQEFATQLGEHSAKGSANTMRGVQARRPSIYDLEDGLKKMTLPVLVMVGDEDFHCLQPGIFMKMAIPAAGLVVLPKSGHTLNLEEPEAFNRQVAEFIAAVEAGAWGPRDPRANPGEIMKTK